MFPTPMHNGGQPPLSAPPHHQQQQYQQQPQQDYQSQQDDSLDSQYQHHLHHQSAQHEATMQGLHQQRQQHMMPSIVAPKPEDMNLLQNLPSGPWSSEDYDSMMRTILDATLPSDHFTDLEAPASFGSLSASYAGSFVSGSSDSGASPHSINDLVYGANNFPTPPESDMPVNARSLSFSLGPHNGTAFSPDGSLDLSNTSYAPSFSGSDITSPYAQNFNIHASSSNSPFGFHTAQPPAASVVSPGHQSDVSTQWNPIYLAPNAAGLHHSPPQQLATVPGVNDLSSASLPSAANDSASISRKRSVAEVAGDENVKSKPASKAAAKKAAAVIVPKVDLADATRKTKKAKATPPAPESKTVPAAATAAPVSQLSSKLPRMEVGSNATALAAIERLKAKRLQESQAAAKAASERAAAAASSQSSDPASSTIEKLNLDPATRQQKKVAHNAIERRYRNNINDRIAALRRAVPALREIRPRKTPSGRRSRKAQQEEDLVDGVPAATKLNKATILGKATDYIKYLKSRELRLNSEVAGLRELVRSLEGGEELLELWEAEMDKVVAEQEAFAAAAAAKEDEEAEGFANAEAEDDDEEDEEEEGDDDEAEAAESSYASASSSSSPPSARSRQGSKGGRGRKSGIGRALSSAASSRYMLATFLGISFIGSGAEFALDSTASDASSAVGRPAAGRVMVGASRQLLKRSATYMAPSTSIAQEVHAFDSVPTHALAFEVLRIVSFAFCFMFLVWPLFSRLLTKNRSTSSTESTSELGSERRDQSRKLRQALSKGEMDVSTFDNAMRSHINAPSSVVLATPGVLAAASRLALTRSPRTRSLVPARRLSTQEAASLTRLLEVETLCEGRAQPSLLLRLHTALRLANSDLSTITTSSSSLATPRLKATLALSFARLGEGIDSVQDLADQLWTDSRASLRHKAQGQAGNAAASAVEKDESLVRSEDASWLSSVLSLDLDTALDLLASASTSTEPQIYDHSAVLAIADTYYCQRLGEVWNTLLASLVRASCPIASTGSPSSLVAEFITLQSKQRLDLDVIRDAEKRNALHLEITSLARTAPPTPRAWQLAQVTLATWSAILGNLPLARHVATILREHPLTTQLKLSSVEELYTFIDPQSDPVSTGVSGGVDAKATLLLSWLKFLRIFADDKTSVAEVHAATLSVRKLVTAALTSDGEEESGEEVEGCLDALTDLCTALGRSANRLGSGAQGGLAAKKLLAEAAAADEDRDSGVEV